MVTKEEIREMMNIQLAAFREAAALLFESSNSRIEEQNRLIYEFKHSLEFTQKEFQDLKAEVTKLRSENVELRKNADENNVTIDKLKKQVASLEDYSRRKNIRIEGIQESPRENWEQTQVKVQEMIDKKLQLENVKVEYAHRISSHQNSNSNLPRTIIARLQHDTDRNTTLRNSWKLKGTQTFINEDLSEVTMQNRKEKMQDFKTARQQGKIAYFKKDQLIIKERKNERATATTPKSQRNASVSQLVNVFTPQQTSDTSEPSVQVTTETTDRRSGPSLRPRN